MRRQTWFTCIICVLGTLPGFIIGGIFKIFFGVFGGWAEAENSDFLFLHALFGIDAPGQLYSWIFARAIPAAFQSAVAGFVAIYATEKICRGAKIELAAHITGALYTGALIAGVILELMMHGPVSEMLLAAVQAAGLWIGLSSAVASLPVYSRTVTQNLVPKRID